MKKSIIRIMGVYSAIPALIFGLTGLIEASTGVGLLDEVKGIPADLFGGLSLLVISLIYLKGVISLLKAENEGLSYLFVGALITFAVSGLYISMLSATWFGETIVAEFEPHEGETDTVEDEDTIYEEQKWNPIDDFRIEMLYFLLTVPGFMISKKNQKV